jgi:TP901 family phage tail tape measure protein
MAATAREVAKETTFSAEEAAEAYFFLASAGLDAEQQIAAMPQVAKFAQAGMFDMALATDLATDAQSALGLSSDDAQQNLENLTRVTDVFVKANTLANTSVEQLATAFTTKAGTALKTVGKDVEEGAAALAVFADQGIKGERAGTLLTNTIFGLTDIMKKAPDEAKRLGLEIFDAEGQMKSFADISANLTEILGPMSTEQQVATLANLGFTKQAREGTLALLGQSDAIAEYEGELRNAGGTAADVAENQLQTFSAQLELAKSQVADVGLEIGSTLMPSVMTLLDGLVPVIEDSLPAFKMAFEALTPVINMIAGLLPMLLNAIVPLIKPLVDITVQVIQLAVSVFPALMSIVQAVFPILLTLTQIFLDLIEMILTPIIPIIMSLVEAFVPLIEQILPILTELIEALLPPMLELLEELFIPLIPVVMELVEAFLPMLEAILPIFIELLEFLIPILDAVIEIIKTAFVNSIAILSSAIEGFSSFFKIFADTFLNIWQAIEGTVKNVVNSVLGFIQSMVNGVVDGVNAVIRALNKFRINIPATPFSSGFSFGLNIPELSRVNIPQLADGGVVMPRPGGVLANIAEAGKPEAVIPLDRFDQMGGSTYNVTINAGVGSDPVAIGREVVNAIKRYESTNGKVFASA